MLGGNLTVNEYLNFGFQVNISIGLLGQNIISYVAYIKMNESVSSTPNQFAF